MLLKSLKSLLVALLLLTLIGCGSSGKEPSTSNSEVTLGAEVENDNVNNIEETNDETENNNVASQPPVEEVQFNYPSIGYILNKIPSKVTLSSDGKQIYLAHGIEGFSIINIADKNDAFLLGDYSSPKFGIAIDDIVSSSDGNTLYLGTSEGIYIYDISDLDNLVNIGFFSASFSTKMTLNKDGKILYVQGSDGLFILDVSTPNSIIQLGFYETFDLKDIVLSKDETLIYLATGSLVNGGMEIVDISNKNRPILKSKLFDEISEHVDRIVLSEDGTKMYVANSTKEFITQEVILRKKYLTVVDISSSTNPKILKTTERYESEYKYFGMELSLDKNKIYIGAGSKGFAVMSIANNEPRKIGLNQVDGNIWDFVLSLDKQLAYIVTGNRNLLIMDIK